MDYVSISDSMKRTASIAFRWILFLSYASLILALSLLPSLPGHSRVPDKLGHAAEYMLLTILAARALQQPQMKHQPRNLALVFGFCAAFAAFDEFVQSYIPGRDAALGDWFADISGITLSILLILRRSYKERALPDHETN